MKSIFNSSCKWRSTFGGVMASSQYFTAVVNYWFCICSTFGGVRLMA